MIGLSRPGKEKIGKIVDDMFDNIALQLIGDIPRLRNKKLAIISMERHFGLPHLFVQAMQNKMPNQIERDLLQGLLNSTDGYIEALKSRTRSNIMEAIDGVARKHRFLKTHISRKELDEIITEEMQKAKSHLTSIVESEATKLRNLGTLMNISRMAASVGDNDPTVFFAIIKDNVTCKECIRLHLEDNGVTPRLWKFSELKQGYHKRGEDEPSAFGEHPHCRCTLVYLSKGFGFDEKGKTTYISENYDAYKARK